MTELIVLAAYFFVGVLTGFYIGKVGRIKGWHSDDFVAAQTFGSFFWPVAWLIMAAWLISTKIGVPR